MLPTIKDVSAAAGVSIRTVSRMLNKERYVSTDTRERVERAVADLNFKPSAAARTLAGRRSFQIALIYDNHSPHSHLAPYVGADLAVMHSDPAKARGERPYVFTDLTRLVGVGEVARFITQAGGLPAPLSEVA